MSADPKPGEPREAAAEPPARTLSYYLRPIWEAAAVGLILGTLDANSATGTLGSTDLQYLVAGLLLGLRHAGRARLCWPPLGVSLYAVHVAAIAYGYRQPYVEAGYREATNCLSAFFPSGMGLAAGVGTRILFSAPGRFRTESGTPWIFRPRTPRGLLTVIAVLCIGLGTVRWLYTHAGTVYARGYNEVKFQCIRAGMAASHVEAILGPPLDKVPWSKDGTENWMYSTQRTATSDYWRRWIFVKQGKVEFVVSEYYYD